MSVAAIIASIAPPPAPAAQQEQQTTQQLQDAVAQVHAQAAQAAEQAVGAARQAAAQAAVAGVPAPPPVPGATNITADGEGRLRVANPDGSTTIINQDGSSMLVRPNGQVEYSSVPTERQDDIPPQVMNVIDGFFVTLAIICIGTPLARAFGRRLDRSGAKARVAEPSPEMSERMERIEHAVDSIAVEVERISEGQRFTTKLLTDRGDTALERQAPRKDVVGGSAR